MRFFTGEALSKKEIAEREADGYRLLPDGDGTERKIDWATKKGIQRELDLVLTELIPAAVHHYNLAANGSLREGQITRLNDRVKHLCEVARHAVDYNAVVLAKWTNPDGFVRAADYYLKTLFVDLKPLQTMVDDMDALARNGLVGGELDKAFDFYLLAGVSDKSKKAEKAECAMEYEQLKSIVRLLKQHVDLDTKDLSRRFGGVYVDVRNLLAPSEVLREHERVRMQP
ncbi:MAG: hypothetical protein P1U63_05680 [Coxiellaceae bacterium]|nr:hypothetical protein [Coxiellaceae bacterium]